MDHSQIDADTDIKATASALRELNALHRLVSGLSDYEISRLLYHLLQRREWDGQNGRPWDAYLCGQSEREIQMLISR